LNYRFVIPYTHLVRSLIFKPLHKIETEVKNMAREKIMLTAEQKTKLEGLTGDIEWLQTEIGRAEYVGLDVADLKARFEKMKTIRVRMLEEYGN
jgi:hypothetical protein